MPSQFDALRVTRDTILDVDFFNGRFRLLDDRLVSLEGLSISWEEALRVVQDNVLSRSEDVISSLRDKLLSITELGWLTSSSATPATLVEGGTARLAIPTEDVELFTPGPYSVVSRTGSPTDYALVSTQNFDRLTGNWDIRVESAVGLVGEFSDWQIAAVAGSTLVQLAYLAEGKTARDDAQAARQAADDDAAATASDRQAVSDMKADVEAMSAGATGASGFDARITTLEGRKVSTSGLASGGGDLSADRTISVPAAAVADVRGGTDAGKAWTSAPAYGAAAPVAVAYAATIALNLSNGSYVDISALTGNLNLANPSGGMTPGRSGRIRIPQDGTGARSISYGTYWKSPGGPQALSTAPGAVDCLYYYIRSNTEIEYTIGRDVK